MPMTLNEMGGQKSQKYTVLDASVLTDYDTVRQAYGPQPTDYYDSDNTTGVITPKAKAKMGNYIPQDYLQNIRSNYPPVTPQRTMSLAEADKLDKKANPPLTGVSMYPPTNFAGVTPPMQNALKNDTNVSMKEYYHVNMSGQSCVDTLNHVMNCPMCSRYFKCDTKVYNVIILMLIILFATIMFFSYKEEVKRR
jgi:hypothetical protein|uniref:Uncharacterized protein n=1 Tax=viral metagenome TaxID=1070528 RepID=A0A6C0HF02_9ZZZZ